MKRSTKGKIIKGSAVALDVAAPLIATFYQFPVWVEESSEATVSGLFLVFACLSAIPFVKQIKSWLKSPSVWVLWVVMFVMFSALQNIINEMVAVCFVGAVSNVIGTGIYKVGQRFDNKEDE